MALWDVCSGAECVRAISRMSERVLWSCVLKDKKYSFFLVCQVCVGTRQLLDSGCVSFFYFQGMILVNSHLGTFCMLHIIHKHD